MFLRAQDRALPGAVRSQGRKMVLPSESSQLRVEKQRMVWTAEGIRCGAMSCYWSAGWAVLIIHQQPNCCQIFAGITAKENLKEDNEEALQMKSPGSHHPCSGAGRRQDDALPLLLPALLSPPAPARSPRGHGCRSCKLASGLAGGGGQETGVGCGPALQPTCCGISASDKK